MKTENARFEAAYGNAGQLPASTVPEIAFSGRSNVGKSSLINRLLKRKALARTSSTPGKTATINFYDVDGVRFCDLPGYGFAKVSQSEKKRWSELVEGYFDGGRNLILVVQLVDMRHPPSELDLSMMQYMLDRRINFIVALTKSDKLNKTEREKRMEGFREELAFLPEAVDIVPFSATKGEGAQQILATIRQIVN